MGRMSGTVSSAYGQVPLDPGIRSRLIENVNGLTMHVLEAGFEEPGRPSVLLLHGFPELAYSWRRVMPTLAAAGYHVIAPDQRGYGRTTGWNGDYDGDLASFRLFNLVRDVVALLAAMEVPRVALVAGHDFGASVAPYCTLFRPDLFGSLVLMSAPFAGPPALPRDAAAARAAARVHDDLAALKRPRKHYQWYYSTREANAHMHRCPEGVHALLRAYFHHKSADWPGNTPVPLKAWTAEELAQLPTYYIMDLDRDMAATVAEEMPTPAEIAACRWLPEDELAVYAAEFERNGFQGGLQWYRCRTGGVMNADLDVLSGRTVDVPAAFISGASDWGNHQVPGALEKMQGEVCTDLRGIHLVEGAGHWVQQEQAGEVSRLMLAFLAGLS